MRGYCMSIGAIVLSVTFGIWNASWWQCWLYPNVGLTTIYFLLNYVVLPGGICLEIVDFVRRRTKEAESSLEPLRERIVTERVLVICPYCSTKNEQGIIKCQSCGAKL